MIHNKYVDVFLEEGFPHKIEKYNVVKEVIEYFMGKKTLRQYSDCLFNKETMSV